MDQQVTAFIQACVWTGVLATDRLAWLKARQLYLTASRIAALLGLSPWEDAIDVYVDLVAPQEPEPEPEEPDLNDPRLWGQALEEAVARTAARFYGWDLRMSGALLASKRYPWLAATPDAEITFPDEGGIALYEGKTTAAWRWRDWNDETGEPPDHVLIQAQTQLIVTGAPLDVVCCLIGGQRFRRIDVLPDPTIQGIIVEVGEDLMDRVKRLDPPPPTWRSADALKRLFPGDVGTASELPRDAVEWTRELFAIAARRKDDEKREAELKNRLRLSIGDATWGVLPEPIDGKSRWQWKKNKAGVRVLQAVKGDGK